MSSSTWRTKLGFSWGKQVPLVMQAEASECGIACLNMISQFYGKHIQLRELRAAMPASQQGLSLQQLIEYASTLGFSSRPLKLELEDISELQRPAILHWNFSHYVVLKEVNKTHITILNPAVGIEKLSIAAASKCFTGIALELSPNHQFSPQIAGDSLSLWDFIRPVSGFKSQMFLLIMLSLLIQVFALASPLYMQTVIDKIIATSAHNLLTTLALGFFLLLLIDSVTHYIRETVILRFSQLFNLHVSNSVLGHMLRLPLDYFQRRHIGDIVSRFGSLQPVREILTKGLVSALIDGLLSVVTLVVMFTYSVKLALIVLAIVFIYSACRWFFFYPIKQLNQQILQSDASQQSYFMQSIRAMRTIKLASTEARTQAKWLNHFIDNANQRIRLGQWNIGFSVVNKILFGLENLIVVYIAANLAIQNELSVGMLFAFMSYKGRFVSATATLIDQWIEYKILNVHLARLEDIVYQSTECSQNTEDKLSQHAQFQTLAQSKNNPTGASMTVSELAYQHHSNQALLFSNLHLSINSGDCIAIIGASGCGKTSLLHCLLGLNTPTDGTILLNDKRLSPQTRSLHRVAAVMQDDQLLSGSIKDNICQFDEHINIANMISAAKIACVDTDILAMTMQYETLIGDMGSSLSGGQKQRILLARALYQQPELLILDEATSHLDINTEAKVCANLKQLNTSIIMVAHRPQTIASADKIYTLSPLGLTEISYPGDDTPAQPQATNKEDPYAN